MDRLDKVNHGQPGRPGRRTGKFGWCLHLLAYFEGKRMRRRRRRGDKPGRDCTGTVKYAAKILKRRNSDGAMDCARASIWVFDRANPVLLPGGVASSKRFDHSAAHLTLTLPVHGSPAAELNCRSVKKEGTPLVPVRSLKAGAI